MFSVRAGDRPAVLRALPCTYGDVHTLTHTRSSPKHTPTRIRENAISAIVMGEHQSGGPIEEKWGRLQG